MQEGSIAPKCFSKDCINWLCAALPCEGSEDPVLLAVSDVITFQNYNEPLQGHLVLTNDPTEVM